MRPAAANVMWSVCLTVRVCVCLFVITEPYKDDRTDQGAVLYMGSCGPKEPCIRWRPLSPRGVGNLGEIPSVMA